ncbi:hydratase [Limnohabitans sp. MMS-10A-160]|uniref:2-keto-4-pentenoate hydratase n=1 Tax=unclassified Limnohabitans TaxID=2626134 RepID=UPI000D391CDC|nr:MULTISPECIES: fumarylacetoacetate hydrolase family protein [unclassified Limnohabitans]PUE19809.1 hydratase [Limnohabitans sp. MMS-10A-192]PUE27134.1 hydratase [Limnohabitans sp. MMS-10A-160]
MTVQNTPAPTPQDLSRQAAQVIWSHWQSGQVLSALPEACRPQTAQQGYAAQAQLPGVAGRSVVGWKIAATSTNGQAHINVSGPLAGRLLSGQVFESGASVPSAGNRMRVAEPEFAFAMGQDLPPQSAPYTQDQVMAAVATLHPAIEVPDSRMEPFTAAGQAQLLADNACARHFVLGPAAPDLWRTVDLSTYPVHAHLAHNAQTRYAREGTGGNVLGDPRIALTWLANQLSSLGITLQKGQVVTTGTCMVPLEIEPGDTATADYGALGRVSMTFSN